MRAPPPTGRRGRPLRSPLAWVILASAPGVAGCEPAYPGERVGTFAILGALDENTCGQGLPAVDPLEFSVDLRAEPDGAAYWRRPSLPALPGAVTNGTYRFRTTSVVAVWAPDPATETAGCALQQTEEVRVSVAEVEAATPGDAGTTADAPRAGDAAGDELPDGAGDAGDASDPELALTGTNRISLAPTAGSDCRPSLATYGGPFDALPCAVRYELLGTERAPF